MAANLNGDTKNLAAALLAFQREKVKLSKDKTNPRFDSKYTSLEATIDGTVEAMSTHGLVFTSRPSGTAAEPTLVYELMHPESGEEIAGEAPLMLDKPSSQAEGSALTYKRRQVLQAILNVAGDDDDDGNAAESAPAKLRSGQSYGRMPETGEAATDPQKKKIRGDLSRAGAKGWDIQHAIYRELFGKDLPRGKEIADVVTKAQAGRVIDRIRQGALPTGVSDVPDEGAPVVEQAKLGDEGVPF